MLVYLYIPSLLADSKWSLSYYHAVITEAPIEEALFRHGELDHGFQLGVLVLNRRIKRYRIPWDFELEGQVAKHFSGQDHFELNLAFIARWRSFPWNRWLKTSIAIGEGFSWASETPPFEVKLHEDANAFLNYLMLEFAFGHPRCDRWEIIFRNHHRSGAWGIFNGVQGGSNALSLGFRYYFR